MLNAGIIGNRILHDGIAPNALARFDRDVPAQAGLTHVIVLQGINDIGLDPAAEVNPLIVLPRGHGAVAVDVLSIGKERSF